MCKVLYFVGSLVGKGSSLPGQIALKLFPNVLGSLSLPKNIIAVTGSNGKTSTAELLAQVFKQNGLTVGWNHEGSNQTEGVATLLLPRSTLGGKVQRDVLVLECDERYALSIFKAVKPSAVVVTNLCRDQLTRNGHHEFISDCIRAAVDAAGSEVKLVLNADDPYVAALAYPQDSLNTEVKLSRDVVWFGIGEDAVPSENGTSSDSTPRSSPYKYDDGAFCPLCKHPMNYNFKVTAHFGGYCCGFCGFSRQEPSVEVKNIDFGSGLVDILCSAGLEVQAAQVPVPIRTRLAIPSLIGAYNLATAMAAASTAGISPEATAQALDMYGLKGGRTVSLTIGGRNGILLISKHENSMAYNQNLAWAVMQKKPCTVVIAVDSISRKYYTSETSWLWDIGFDILDNSIVENVVLTGRYVSELATRFAMSAAAPEKISYAEDFSTLREHLASNTKGEIYILTCFSDKAKLLRSLEDSSK